MTKTSKPTETSEMPKTIRIRQIRSGICTPVDQKAALVGLGLRNIRDVVVREDTPSVRGQVRKIRHLVEIIETA